MPPGRPALLAQPSGPRVADASAEGDIAALASAAYFALCGVAPSYFHHMSAGNDAQDSAAPGFLAPPSIHRPDLPPAVQDVLVNALTPASEVRYANAGAFAAALQKAARPGSGIFIPALAFRPLVSRIAAVLAAVLLLGAVLIHFASIHTAQPAVIPPAAPTASPSVGVVPPSTPVPATSRNSAVAPITVPPPVSLPSPARPRTVASAASPKR